MTTERKIAAAAVWLAWAGCAAAALFLVRGYGSRLPQLDEWCYVAESLGQAPTGVGWFWRPHNEHRIPLGKLATLGVLPLAGHDHRALMGLNVALLAASAALVLLAVRRWRGHWTLADCCIPLACLGWGHFENLLWGFQVPFCLFTLMACALLALALSPTPSRWRLVLAALITLTLPGTGAPGLALTPALALWWAGVAAGRWRSGERGAAIASGVVALLAALWPAAYFGIAYGEPVERPPSPGRFAELRALLLYLGQAFGPFQQLVPTAADRLPALGLGVFALVALTGGLWALRRRAVGPGWWGGLCLLVGMLCLALGIGRGRATGDWASAPRYATLALPLLMWLYLAWDRVAPPAVARTAQALLAALVLAFVWPNAQLALIAAGERQAAFAQAVGMMRTGAPAERVAEHLHRTNVGLEATDFVMDRLRRMRDAGVKSVRDWPATPTLVEEPLTRLPPMSPEALAQPTWRVRLPAGPPVRALRVRYRVQADHAESRLTAWRDGVPVFEVSRPLDLPTGDSAEREVTVWLALPADAVEIRFAGSRVRFEPRGVTLLRERP